MLLQEFKEMNIENLKTKAEGKTKNEKIMANLNVVANKINKKEENDKEELDKRFERLIAKIDDETARKELLNDLKSPENMDKINNEKAQNENYFLLQNSNEEKTKIVIKKDLNDVKKKIIEKHRAREVGTKAMTIPLDESLNLVREQTRRYQVTFLRKLQKDNLLFFSL
jgi:hypothetical protein